MIEIEKHYKLTLSEEQGRQVYLLLLDAKDVGGAGFSVANHFFGDAMSSCEVRK